MKFFILASQNNAPSPFKTGKSSCIYFETGTTKVLYGLGGNGAIFSNAIKFGIDISSVDVLILPSARENVCGSLKQFLKSNSHAKIYGRQTVWGEYFKKTILGKVPCGIAKFRQRCKDRFVPIEASFALDTTTMMLNTLPSVGSFGEYYRFVSMKESGQVCQGERLDDYSHELSLSVITEKGCVLLVNNTHSGLRGVLQGAEALQLPVLAVVGSLEIFNRVKTKNRKALHHDLQSLNVTREVELILDGMNTKTIDTIRKTFVETKKLISGDIIEY